MTASVRRRLIIIGIVLAFALFNLYPTLKWASLSQSGRVKLTARWEKQSKELREDLNWDRLSSEAKLADIGEILSPLQEAYQDNKPDKKFWERVNNPDLTALSEDEKESFLSFCEKLLKKEIPRDATSEQLKGLVAPIRNLRKELDKGFWNWVQAPKWETLSKKDKEEYRRVILQLTGKRVPRTPTVARNIRQWLKRWWEGDESQVISLGLDLKGGSYFVLEVEKPKGVSLADATEGAIGVLSERVNRTGVREPIIQRQGLNKIIVQLPGLTDVSRQRRLIERQASMRWMLVDEDRLKLSQFSEKRLLELYQRIVDELGTEFQGKKDEQGNPVEWTMSDLDEKLKEVLPPDTILRVYEREERHGGRKVKQTTPLLLQSSPEQPEVVKGSELTKAQATRDPNTREPVIAFALNREGTRRFGEKTLEFSAESKNRIRTPRGYRGWQLAILLDDKVISAPGIRTQIVRSGQIEGNFTPEEARDLAIQLKAGALPAKLKTIAQNTIGPTLGADSVRKGVSAAILGLVLVVIFMAVYYLLAGMIANFALALNMVIILGVLASLRATLTLPGIAGIILTIGMAVDANVLIFERIREELTAAKKIAAAIDSGYQKAFRTILDANVTTFISALVLYYVGSGPVRGFAVTLMIGIATSMFTAIVVTRVVFDLLLKSRKFRGLPMLAFLHNPKLDFVRQRKKAFVISLVLIVVGMTSFGAKWSRNFGIDFSSGQSATLVFEKEVTTGQMAKIRSALASNRHIEGFNLRRLQLQGDNLHRGVKVDAKIAGSDRSISLERLVADVLRADNVLDAKNPPTVAKVFPTVAHRLWRQATIALVVAMLGMVIYISWRFEFRFAVGAILAIVHDVLITVGVFTGWFILARRQLNLPIVAALLAIIGYSINDTIVIFDRIREDMKIMKGVGLKKIINTSINQTLSRTLLTSLTTLVVVLCLFVLGGEAINDFAFALLIGVIVGTYSSIFIASPIVLLLEKKR